MSVGPPADTSPPPRAEERQPPPRATFTHLSRWDWLAFVAALALMFAMSVDWYTTKAGEEFRRIEKIYRDPGQNAGDAIDPEEAAQKAEAQEKNAWQASAFVDRLILIALLTAAGAAMAAAFLRALGRSFEPPLTPAGIAAIAGTIGAVLILYRMIEEPGLDEASVLRIGLPLSLAAVGVLAFAARQSMLAERREADEQPPAPRGAPVAV